MFYHRRIIRKPAMSGTQLTQHLRRDSGLGEPRVLLLLLVLVLFGLCLQEPVLAEGEGDAYLNVFVDNRVIIAPQGSFTGAPTNVPCPEVERASNGDLYVRAENSKFYKSTDGGLTWTSQEINLPIGSKLVNFGITDQDRFYLVHQADWTNLYVSYSDNYGADGSWTSQGINIPSLHPPGSTEDYHYASIVRGPVMQLDDGTLQFGVDLRHQADAWDPWPPATPFGEALIRSTDNGATWGDPTFLRVPDSYLFETDYAIDPRDPDHIFAATRAQRYLLPGENEAEVRAVTGAPAGSPWVYKNGMLMESTDGGRSFEAVEGGVLDWYEHRNSIAWADEGVVALLSEGAVVNGSSGASSGEVLVRLSVDHGGQWFNGGPVGREHVGDPTVTEFVLHSPDVFGDGHEHIANGASSTIYLGDDSFLTVYGGLVDDPGIENGEMGAVLWHIEGILVPEQNPGDVNEDGFVGGADISQVIHNWGMASPTWSDGDVAGPGGAGSDGLVSAFDYAEVKGLLGTSYPPEPPGEPIPEPATLTIIAAAGCCALLANGRKERKKK